MTESLKSVRILHNLLVVVCAAIIIFAAAPDRDRSYSKAEHEIANYSGLSYNDYLQYLYSLPVQYERNERHQVIEMLRQRGYRVADNVSFVVPMWANPLNIGGSLGTFCKLVVQEQTITLAHVVQDYPGPLRPLDSSEAALKPVSQGIVTAIFLGSGPNIVPTPKFQLLNGNPTGFPNPSSLVLSIRRQDGEQILSSLRVVYISGKSETGYFGKDWLKTLGYASHMIEGNGCLPDSLQIYPELAGMQPGDALRYLASQREAEKKNDLELSSLRIDSATVGWTAPIILGLLLVFFISHLRHLRFLLKESASAKDYPWVGLFADRVGAVIAYSTIVAMPILSEFLLAIRVATVSPAIRYCAPILIIGLSIWAMIEVRGLRKIINY